VLGAGAVGACGLAISFFLGQPLLDRLYGFAYAQQHESLTLLAIAATFGYAASAFGFGSTAARLFHGQVAVCLAATAVTAGVAIAAIPVFALQGAALAAAAGNTVQFIGFGLLVAYGTREDRVAAP
jgi:hypothetical protein